MIDSLLFFWPLGEIVWKQMPALWVVVLLIGPAVLGFVVYVYQRETTNLSIPARWFLGLCRLAILVLVLLILFEPVDVEVQYETLRSPSHVLLLTDTSLSMSDLEDPPDRVTLFKVAALLGKVDSDFREEVNTEEDVDEALSDLRVRGVPFDLEGFGAPFEKRLDLLNALLESEKIGFLEKLKEEHKVVEYVFAQDLVRKVTEGAYESEGEGAGTTAIGDAIASAIRSNSKHSIAGVVLLTDGQNTGGELRPLQAARTAADQGIPVYTVGFGSPVEPRDVFIANLDAENVVFKGNLAPFRVQLGQKGFPEGVSVTVEIRRDGSLLTQKEVRLEKPGVNERIDLSHRFDRAGVYDLKIVIPTQAGERDQANNVRFHRIRVVEEKIRVLYVAGRPSWEFRYLKNALIREPTMKVNTLLLSADPGFPQDRSADAPSMDNFPMDRKTLYDFHVILFSDFNPGELGPQAEKILKEVQGFVGSGRIGGGFIFSAGVDSATHFKGTPIEKILPIVFDDRAVELESYEQVFHPTLTPLGKEHSITRLQDDSDKNRALWSDREYGLPGLFWFLRTRKLKPGAQVLLAHPDAVYTNRKGESVPMPLVSLQRYGRGRTVLVGLDSTWRWRYLHGDRFFWRFWKQAIFYAAKGRLQPGSNRFRLETDKTIYYLGDRVPLRATVVDENYEPSTNKSVQVHYTITRWDGSGKRQETEGKPIKLPLEQSDRPGVYAGVLQVHRVGEYRLVLHAEGTSESDETEKAQAVFTVKPSAREREHPFQDRRQLQRVAETTGGRYFPSHDLDRVPETIRPRARQLKKVIDVNENNLWHDGRIYAALVLLLLTEWVVRKLNRLT